MSIYLKEDADLFPKDANDKWLFSDVDYLETWSGMEECVKAGYTKSIGLSNFNKDQTERIITSGNIPPAVLQVSKLSVEMCGES